MQKEIMSHKRLYYIFITTAIFLLISLVVYFHCTISKNRLNTVKICQSGITIPRHGKHVGLLGSTPHPTQYLIDHDMDLTKLRNLTLDAFLDCQALKDSFEQLFALCKERDIDYLLIAYLPVYFAKFKMTIKDQCTDVAYNFFQHIAPQIQKIIQNIATCQQSTMQIVLHVPSREACAQIPEGIHSDQQYCQYLIKQFPVLDWTKGELERITIINTKVDDPHQTDDIIKYLQYEYLFARPVEFASAEINKKSFHTYKHKAGPSI